MEPCCGNERRARLLGLGNELLADDGFGILVAREAERRFGGSIEVAVSSEAGFSLLDCLLGAARLVVVDTVQTGRALPGTLMVFQEDDLRPATGGSPHFTGLFDVLAAARALGLDAPAGVTIVGVEAADCLTVGGAIHPAVRDAVATAADLAWHYLEGYLPSGSGSDPAMSPAI